MDCHNRITATLIASALALTCMQSQASERLRVISHVDGQPNTRLGGHEPALSADGRYVAFYSGASLTADDSNGRTDVFVYDADTCRLDRVSLGGTAGGGARPFRPAISASGRYVAFTSELALVSSDNDSHDDVYLYDRETSKTKRISAPRLNPNDPLLWRPSKNPAISADGRYVVFESERANLLTGDTNGTSDIFRYSVEDQTIELVSIGYDGEQRGIGSVYPQISADGQWVTFSSSANFIGGNIPNAVHLYGRNMLAKSVDIRLLDRNKFGEIAAQGISRLDRVAISGDGNQVAFSSSSANMRDGFAVGNASPNTPFVFQRNMDNIDPGMRLEMADHDVQIPVWNLMPTLSYDGEWMAFSHGNSSLYPRKPYRGLYRVGSNQPQPLRITPAIGGGQENGTSEDPSISADGQRVAYASTSGDLIANSGSGKQVYLLDLDPFSLGLPVCPDPSQRAR